MAARLVGTGLLLLLVCGAVSPGIAREPKTAFEKYLFSGIKAEQAGRLVEAEKLFLAAIAEAKKSGPGDPRLGLALSNLADLYWQTGEEVKAAKLRKQALAADQRAREPVDARVVNDLGNQAFFCYLHHQDTQAEKLFKQALQLQEQNPEVSDYQKTNILRNLSELYSRQHRYAECEPLLERALEIIDNSTEPWNPQEVVTVRRSLADVYRREGKESEAQELEDRAYEGIRPLGNPAVHSIVITMHRAEDSRRYGNLIAAEAAFREVIAATENTRGLPYTSILIAALDGMGRVCADGERNDEAEDFLLRAFALREQYASLGDPWMASDLSHSFDLLGLYQKQGRPFDMEPIYERALAIQEKVLGPDDKAAADTSLLLADLYFQEEKYREALPLFARAAKIHEKNLGPSRQLADTLGKYAALLKRLGEEEEADAVRARAQAILDRLASQNKEP